MAEDKKFAYVDKGNVLHVTVSEDSAKEYSKHGKYVETTIPSQFGYPVVPYDDKLEQIIVYGLDEAYVEGNRTDGKKVDLTIYHEVYDLYKSVM